MDCKVCGNARSSYVMNNRLVCLHCDELLFDLEIELEENEKPAATDRPTPTKDGVTPTVRTQKS